MAEKVVMLNFAIYVHVVTVVTCSLTCSVGLSGNVLVGVGRSGNEWEGLGTSWEV